MEPGNKVYLETSFISYLVAKDSVNIFVLARQRTSRDWWTDNRVQFKLYVSDAVIREASRGNVVYANDRIEFLTGLEILAATEAALGLAEELVRGKAIPENAVEDAAHIAIAAVHKMDYLLTWNFRHINNALRKKRISDVCNANGFILPQICTPEELKEGLDDQ